MTDEPIRTGGPEYGVLAAAFGAGMAPKGEVGGVNKSLYYSLSAPPCPGAMTHASTPTVDHAKSDRLLVFPVRCGEQRSRHQVGAEDFQGGRLQYLGFPTEPTADTVRRVLLRIA